MYEYKSIYYSPSEEMEKVGQEFAELTKKRNGKVWKASY